MLTRYRHSTVVIELAPGLIEVTFFGGSPLWDPKKSYNDLPKLAGTVIMTFGMSTANVVHIITTASSRLTSVVLGKLPLSSQIPVSCYLATKVS